MECTYIQSESPSAHLRIPLYAQAPGQTIHPTPFYIEDLLGKNVTHSPVVTFRIPFTSSVHEPPSVRPSFWPHAGLTAHTPVFLNAVSPLCAPGEYGRSMAKRDRCGNPLLWTPLILRPLQIRKGGQVRFSNEQTLRLEATFETQKYLPLPDRKRLAKTLHISERQVKTWFQNRRAKWRRLKQEAPLGSKREGGEDAAESVGTPGRGQGVGRDQRYTEVRSRSTRFSPPVSVGDTSEDSDRELNVEKESSLLNLHEGETF